VQKITPMLWFDDQADGAADHYVSVFSKCPGSNRGESKVLDVSRYGEAGPGPAGSVMVVRFQLEGEEFTALNGGPQQFAFSEAISFVINCETQEEVDYFWSAHAGWRGRAVRLAQGPVRSVMAGRSDRDGENAE